MDLKSSLKRLQSSDDFLKWKEKNKHTYFSYAFKIPQEMADDWHLGFYNKDKDKITTFVVTGNNIDMRQEEELFKEHEKQVSMIQLENLKLSFDEIMAMAGDFQQKNYSKDKAVKTIAILQNAPNLGDIWNITFITQAFNTLNMKIDASSGKIIEHKMVSIFDFRSK